MVSTRTTLAVTSLTLAMAACSGEDGKDGADAPNLMQVPIIQAAPDALTEVTNGCNISTSRFLQTRVSNLGDIENMFPENVSADNYGPCTPDEPETLIIDGDVFFQCSSDDGTRTSTVVDDFTTGTQIFNIPNTDLINYAGDTIRVGGDTNIVTFSINDGGGDNTTLNTAASESQRFCNGGATAQSYMPKAF